MKIEIDQYQVLAPIDISFRLRCLIPPKIAEIPALPNRKRMPLPSIMRNKSQELTSKYIKLARKRSRTSRPASMTVRDGSFILVILNPTGYKMTNNIIATNWKFILTYITRKPLLLVTGRITKVYLGMGPRYFYPLGVKSFLEAKSQLSHHCPLLDRLNITQNLNLYP